MVVPPLQAIVPAVAVTERLQATAGNTCIDVVEVLSARLSPVNEPGPVQTPVPGPKDREPAIVEGPPTAGP